MARATMEAGSNETWLYALSHQKRLLKESGDYKGSTYIYIIHYIAVSQSQGRIRTTWSDNIIYVFIHENCIGQFWENRAI